ncbi:MAG: polysaccharide biosynthesis protein [Thermoclostridium sp.]|nr:polysaccharide biosynthesis protein [Thermoclostridium sp.]
MGKKNLKQNAFILTIAGFIVKSIGFIYRIYIANSIGAEGMGLYQLVLPIYNLVLLGLTAGVGIAVARLVAEETARGNPNNANRVAIVAGTTIFAAAAAVVAILYLKLDFVVNVLIGDIRTKSALFWILPAIPFIAAITALKGYFYGKQEVVPNALSQIAEQLVKLIVVFTIADIFSQGDMERKCLFATIGMITGEIANVLVVFLAFQLRKGKKAVNYSGKLLRKRDIEKSLLGISLPITANRLILSLLGTVEFIWIPQRLALFGMTNAEALAEYGKLTGMASPVITFPSMLTAALATALVPAIAEAAALKRMNGANRQISRSIRLTLVLGFLFTSLFLAFGTDISEIIYPGQNVGQMMFLLSFTGVFFYLQQTLLGVLNGLGKEKETLKHSMMTSVLRLGFVWFGIPAFGMNAYIISLVVTNLVGSVLNLRTTVKTTGMSIELGDWFLKPLIAAISGVIAAPAAKMLAQAVFPQQTMVLLVSGFVTGGLMAVILILLGVFELKDLRQMLPLKIDKDRKL